MSKVELRINRTKTGQHLSSTNVNFDQGNETKLTLVELKCCPVLVRLILSSTFDFF
jgi:hypothetical protein